MVDERRSSGQIRESQLKAVLWSFIAALLVSIGLLSLYHPLDVGKTLTGAQTAVTNSFAPLVHQLPTMQFGTLSRPTTVLFMGTDVVYSDPKRRQVDRGSYRGNSDTMMLVFLNPIRDTVSVLNIPRDTEANVGRAGIQKINSANVIGGPELAKQTVSSLLDVPIDHYVLMNVQGLVQVVNELGGITVNVPKKMSYMDWTGKLKIDLTPGNHTLTGNQAMGFVRFRHDALGDIGRIQRQQTFLHAAMNKMMDPSSWLHLGAMIEIAQRNIETDMSNVDMFQSINFVHTVPHDSIKFVMLPGQFATNGDWLANTDGKALAQRLLNPEQETIRSRRNISVCVINASSDRTLGGKLAKALRKLGYITSVDKDTSEPSSDKTRIIAQNGNIFEAKMLQKDLGNLGQVVNASVGNLLTSMTIVAHDDINLEQITMSSADAPYVEPGAPPQPLVFKPSAVATQGVRRNGRSLIPAATNGDTNSSTDGQTPVAGVGDANAGVGDANAAGGNANPGGGEANSRAGDANAQVGDGNSRAGDANSQVGDDSAREANSRVGTANSKSSQEPHENKPPVSTSPSGGDVAETSGKRDQPDMSDKQSLLPSSDASATKHEQQQPEQ